MDFTIVHSPDCLIVIEDFGMNTHKMHGVPDKFGVKALFWIRLSYFPRKQFKDDSYHGQSNWW